jgi:hypothetical protein
MPLMHQRLFVVLACLAGIGLAIVVWGAVLDVQVRRHRPGLWTMRPQRILACGLDYNGPPFSSLGPTLWLTCDTEDLGWRLWPPWR